MTCMWTSVGRVRLRQLTNWTMLWWRCCPIDQLAWLGQPLLVAQLAIPLIRLMFSNRVRDLDVPTLLLTAASCLLSAVAVPGCDGSKTVSAEPGWPKSDQHNTVAATTSRVPTFYRDICPIVYGHCVACHRPDGSGPFNLLTYADVKGRGSQIAKVTRSRFMPPCLAKAGDY